MSQVPRPRHLHDLSRDTLRTQLRALFCSCPASVWIVCSRAKPRIQRFQQGALYPYWWLKAPGVTLPQGMDGQGQLWPQCAGSKATPLPAPFTYTHFQMKGNPEFTTQVKRIKRLRSRQPGLSPPRSSPFQPQITRGPLMRGQVTTKALNYSQITPTVTHVRIYTSDFPPNMNLLIKLHERQTNRQFGRDIHPAQSRLPGGVFKYTIGPVP